MQSSRICLLALSLSLQMMIFPAPAWSIDYHPSDLWKIGVNGGAEYDSTTYLQSVSQTNIALESVRLNFDGSAKYSDFLRFKLNPFFQADPLNNSISDRYWFDVPEGYVQFQANGWTFQAGYNVFTWGVTDGFNPLDVVSAQRYQDPLNSKKLGAPSLLVKKDLTGLNVEAIYIPWQRKSVLPGTQSRWLPRTVASTIGLAGSQGQLATLNLPPNLDYYYYPDQERDHALENNVGVRVQAPGILPGLDASVEAFNGAAPVPAIDLTASGTVTQFLPSLQIQADPFLGLTPVFYRQWMYGGSLVYGNFGVIFRTEVAVTRVISQGADLPGNAEQYVLGVERPVPIGTTDLTVLAQGAYSRHSDPLSNSSTSLIRIFDRALLLGARLSFSEALSAQLSGLYDTESHGELAHAESSYNLSDSVKLGLAADVLLGKTGTPLGSYNKNERVIASLKTNF
jgi:hypothetical protein